MTPRSFILATSLLLAAGANPSEAQLCGRPCVGPERGAVMAVGGGELDEEVYRRFVSLAGGADAKIVLIPTAGARYGSHDAWSAIEKLRAAGVEQLEILHTRSASVADLEAFSAPLREATGVWFSGGRQFRLVDVYLDTSTHDALREVLARGGIIAGNSAGASALASFLLRGSEDPSEVVAPDNRRGFGFLSNVAIDQHLTARGRENDLTEVIKEHPDLLGIGLDEGSALLVRRDLAEVIGARVAIYDATNTRSLFPFRWLRPGDVYDLGARRSLVADVRLPG